jgi:hypothetical protein
MEGNYFSNSYLTNYLLFFVVLVPSYKLTYRNKTLLNITSPPSDKYLTISYKAKEALSSLAFTAYLLVIFIIPPHFWGQRS